MVGPIPRPRPPIRPGDDEPDLAFLASSHAPRTLAPSSRGQRALQSFLSTSTSPSTSGSPAPEAYRPVVLTVGEKGIQRATPPRLRYVSRPLPPKSSAAPPSPTSAPSTSAASRPDPYQAWTAEIRTDRTHVELVGPDARARRAIEHHRQALEAARRNLERQGALPSA